MRRLMNTYSEGIAQAPVCGDGEEDKFPHQLSGGLDER